MRGSRIVGCVGVLIVASACASSTGGSPSTRPTPQRSSVDTRSASGIDADSVLAQAIADREGPGVDVRATFSSNVGSRRVRATFHTKDDAYVVVGHIDPDGVLRIVFPTEPQDDGFVKGDHTYQTSEFFAGFNDQYNFRLRDASLFRSTSAETDSYDRGLGYVFVIATWRPMRFDRFATDGEWDSFELADQDYLKDPRPAVYELASLLSGENREAYTVKFARYYNTQTLYSGYDTYSSAFMYGSGYCPGYAPVGFATSPFDFNTGFMNRWDMMNGYNFWYRGSYYSYDRGLGCYRQSYGGGSYPYGLIASSPVLPPTSRPRGFTLENAHPPIEPRPVTRVHAALETPTTGKTEPSVQSRFSPAYRQRGLITTDEMEPRVPSRRPGVQAVNSGAESRTRPGFTDMVNRREQNGNDGTPAYRTRGRIDDGSSGWSSQPRSNGGQYSAPSTSNPGAESRPRWSAPDAPRTAPVTHESSPRFEAPARMSSPPPAPAPHVESHPVSTPVSAPPAAPPASSSSSTGKPPGR